MNDRGLVMGAGISEMQAGLDIADGGYGAIIADEGPFIGGHTAQLSETFSKLDFSQCMLTPRTVELKQHLSMDLLRLSEVMDVERIPGGTIEDIDHGAGAWKGCSEGFRVRIKTHRRYLIEERCTACGDCAEKYLAVVPNGFDPGLAARWGIYIPSPGSRRVFEMLGIDVDEFGFYNPDNAGMMPIQTGVPGVFLADTGMGAQDIPETVAQASEGSANVLASFQAAQAEGRNRKAASLAPSNDAPGAKETVAPVAVMEAT